MQETGALARHGVFIAPGDVEDPIRHRRQIGRHGHEAVIAVQRDPRPLGARQRGEGLDPVEQAAGAEEDLTDQDPVVPARLRRLDEAVGKGVERGQRHARDDRQTLLFPALGLAAEGMEFSVRGQDAHGPPLERREDPQQEVVGVGGKDQAVGRRQTQFGRHMGLSLGDHFAEDQVPLLVGMGVGVQPGLLLGLETDVGPQMMAVRREMQPTGRRRQSAGEEGFVAHPSPLGHLT